MLQERIRVRDVEIPAGIFPLRLPEDVAIGQRDRRVRRVEGHVHDVFDAEHIHRQTFHPVGQLARHRAAIMTCNLLEIGELRDFHPIAPDFPAKACGAERGAFPVILDKTDVVEGHVDADGFERAEIERLKVRRRGFNQHLILIIVLQPVRVVAIAPVRGAARGLHIGSGPGVRAEAAQRRRGVERARADLHVIGLQHGAALGGPIGLEAENDLLKTLRLVGHRGRACGSCVGRALPTRGAARGQRGVSATGLGRGASLGEP